MKFNVAILSFIVMLCICLFGILRMRNKQQQKNVKLKRFHDIKLRVSSDMLGEYQEEIIKFTTQLKDTDEEIKAFEPEIIKLENIKDQKKIDMDICTGAKKEVNDKLASLESEINLVNAAAETQKTSLAKEVASLTQQMSQRSKVCDYIQTDSDNARKLCGLEAKPAAPKAEEAKPAAPKAEEAKPAAPKAEEAKPAAPKAEEAKPAAPKAEEAKPAAPKAEEAKPAGANRR